MRLSRMLAVAGFLSALALPLSAQADVMMTTSSSGATSSTKASSGTGTSSTSGTGGAGGGGSDSSSGGCSVQPGQTVGAIGLAAIPALALIVLRLRRKKSE